MYIRCQLQILHFEIQSLQQSSEENVTNVLAALAICNFLLKNHNFNAKQYNARLSIKAAPNKETGVLSC